MNNEIELDMWLLLKQADTQEEWDEQKEQEKEYFGQGLASFREYMTQHYSYNQVPISNKLREEMITKNEKQLLNILNKFFPQNNINDEGYFRLGVDLNDLYLKVAIVDSGRILNKREANILTKAFPKTYAHAEDYSWIVVEKAKPFLEKHEKQFLPEIKGFYGLASFLFWFKREQKNTDDKMSHNNNIQKVKNVKPGTFLQQIIDYMKLYPQLATYDLCRSNLGVVKRDGRETPVLIDSSLHEDFGLL